MRALQMCLQLVCIFVNLLLLDKHMTAAAINTKPDFDLPETELTITVRPGATECFYQNVNQDDTMELEYQVIDATFGNVELQQELEIDFQLYSPSGQELILDYKRSDAMHRHTAKQNGDYKLCFDNSKSRFSGKVIYFEVYIDSSDNNAKQWDDFSFAPELQYNDTMDQIKEFINKIHDHLDKVKHHQDQLKAVETRDRNLQEHNFTRVNQFSIIFIIVMLVVGGIQVIMVRSLFEEKSKLHKIFKVLS